MRVFLLIIGALLSIPAMALGEVSAKFESGGLGVGAISTGHNDPGGKSYGTHQLAINTGTLLAYVKDSAFKDILYHHPLGSDAFDKAWKMLAESHTHAFEQDQLRFIAKTHYWPLRRIADSLGYENTPQINEAIFSMGVQHGKAYRILERVAKNMDVTTEGTHNVVVELYAERSRYVAGLRLNKSIKSAILNRYRLELNVVLNLK